MVEVKPPMDKIDLKVPFQTIVRMPNGLQWHKDELFVMDQFTDDVFVFNHALARTEVGALFGNGFGIGSAGIPGRSNISPSSFGPSITV